MINERITVALARLEEELSRLEPAIEHIEAARQVTASVSKIPQLHRELAAALDTKIEQHIEAASEVIRGTHEMASSLLDEIDEERKAIEQVRNQVKAFHDKVELINFPQRLDKLDASVMGILSAVQTLQNRVDNLERSLMDKLQAQEQAIQKQQEVVAKKLQSTQNFVLINLVIGFLILLLFAVKVFLL